MSLPELIAVIAISVILSWILLHIARNGVLAAEQRVRATPVEAVDPIEANVELVHELRALTKRIWFTSYMFGAALAGGGAAGVHWSAIGTGSRLLAGAVLLAAWALPVVVAPRPVAAAYARAREIPLALLRSRRVVAIRVIMIAMWVWPTPVALAVESTVVDRIAFTAVAYLIVVPVAFGLLAPIIARVLAPSQIAPELQRRLAPLAMKAGVRLQATRVIRSRDRKIANAAQVGWLPGLRSIALTDYLLDSLSEAEVDAVFAHELGHARGYHAWKRSVVSSAALFCSGCSIIGATARSPMLALVFVALAAMVAIGQVQRRLAIRQEIAADDVASAIVGPGQLAAALERLSIVNALKRDTSAKWDRKVGHPGMAIRIARLQAQELAAVPDPVP
ncbi:MAG TPA: M48 family metalloprotease [Acidothermaceae bacterium]|nr:M48 family metalloprotease [Acidothermaceae bacterium]